MTKEKEEYKPLTKLQKENIGKYLESRLGIHGIEWFNFKWELTPRMVYAEIGTHKIELEHCGILRYMLSKCWLEVKIWDTLPKKAHISFSYEHVPSGSNGHNTCISLIIHSDGRIIEV